MTGKSISGKSSYTIIESKANIPKEMLGLCLINWQDMIAIVEAELGLPDSQTLMCQIRHEWSASVMSIGRFTADRHGSLNVPGAHFWLTIYWMDRENVLATKNPVYIPGTVRDKRTTEKCAQMTTKELLRNRELVKKYNLQPMGIAVSGSQKNSAHPC